MSSAIELYRDAYDLDYRKGDWETAEELYRKIINRFPHSDECDYAHIHLERIAGLKASPDEQPLRSPGVQSGGSSAFGPINFFLILMLMMLSGALAYMVWQQRQQQEYINHILNGRLSETRGDIKAAGRHYKKARSVLPDKDLAYQHLAELYLASGKFQAAEEAFNLWRFALPGDPGLLKFQSRLKSAKDGPEE